MLKLLRKHWEVFVLFALSILTIWPLVSPGYFSHHDDLHVIRIFEMRKCLMDLQIPCRWAPDMGYGYGIPLFNYYNPFVYYVGAILSFVLGFVWSAKTLFIITLILGPVAMYFLGRELWGKTGGLVSGVLFMFAPYRALDAYVRGALAELFAISLIPLIFLFALRLIRNGKRFDFILLTVLTGVFLTAHNISVILWGPFILLWILYWLYQEKFSNLKLLVLSLLLGLGLSAFFTMPSFLEKDLVTSETLTQGELDYHVHFAGVKQLFLDRFWGWGASKQGPNDDLSMQIGWPHWFVVLIAGRFLAVEIIKRFRRTNVESKFLSSIDAVFFKANAAPFLLIVFFLISVFMTHNKSTPVWETIGILKYLQFPWRYLAVSIFSASLLGGFVVSGLGRQLRIPGTKIGVLTALVILLAISLNAGYFRPEKLYFDVTDEKKISGELWEEQQKGALFDYLPKTAIAPKEKAPDLPKIIKGGGSVANFIRKSASFEFEVIGGSGAWEVEIPVYNFPNWSTDSRFWTGDSGTIVTEGGGSHKITGTFTDTSTRRFSNLISLGSLGVLGFLLFHAKGRKIFS